MPTKAISFEKKVCALRIFKPVRGARLKISVDRNSIEFHYFTKLSVETLRHGLNIRTQNVPQNLGNQKKTGGGGGGGEREKSVTDEEVLPVNESHRYGLARVYRNPNKN